MERRAERRAVIDYLKPVCRPSTIDSYGNVALLLAAMRRALPRFHGAVLDVGCGQMPYKPLLLADPGRVSSVTGLDLANPAYAPDVVWDGTRIPLGDAAYDCAMMTEVLEHCPDPGAVLAEVCRVLKPGGFLFLTVPFIWPMHDVPYDEHRYTPFALRRLLRAAGFAEPEIAATGGRNAVLAVTLGLWALRRPATKPWQVLRRRALCIAAWPLVVWLLRHDERPEAFTDSTMVVGLSVMVEKPA